MSSLVLLSVGVGDGKGCCGWPNLEITKFLTGLCCSLLVKTFPTQRGYEWCRHTGTLPILSLSRFWDTLAGLLHIGSVVIWLAQQKVLYLLVSRILKKVSPEIPHRTPRCRCKQTSMNISICMFTPTQLYTYIQYTHPSLWLWLSWPFRDQRATGRKG